MRDGGEPVKPELVVYRVLLRAKARGARPSGEELAAEYRALTKKHITTAAVTARVRDLRAMLGEDRVPHARRDAAGVYRYEVRSSLEGRAA